MAEQILAVSSWLGANLHRFLLCLLFACPEADLEKVVAFLNACIKTSEFDSLRFILRYVEKKGKKGPDMRIC